MDGSVQSIRVVIVQKLLGRLMNAERRTERPRDPSPLSLMPQLHAGGGQAWESRVSLSQSVRRLEEA